MRIVVVGGVAGGMSFAARARRLNEGAEIIVLERGDHVSFANCGLPYFVGGEIEREESLHVQTPDSLRASLALDVRTGHEVTGLDPLRKAVLVRTDADVVDLGYDKLVLAPGVSASEPQIEGLNSPRVRALRTIDDATALHGEIIGGARRAVVLGAGFIGVEAAEALARQGLEVSLVEFASHPLPLLETELASLVTDELRLIGADVHTGVRAEQIVHEADSDTVVLSDGSSLAADLIVLSVGVRPNTAPFEAAGVACERGSIIIDEFGRTSLPDVWAVGDATVSVDRVTGLQRPVTLAGPASRAGRLVADNMLRPVPARRLPHLVGTAVVRVGQLTVAFTGANGAALERAQIEYSTVHVHPNHHAGYFPGASPIHLVAHFRRSDGRLLGAQAVGAGGVDKRIDVLSTAISAGMTVDDLIDLDLAYSPPYGQAKDPINLVGMVGQNVREGMLQLWYARDLAEVRETTLLLDVRGSDEFETGHIVGSLNIPHTELRERLDDVAVAAAGRSVRVLCASGMRSAIAHRVLTQSGYDSASLSGGILTLRAFLGVRASAHFVSESSTRARCRAS